MQTDFTAPAAMYLDAGLCPLPADRKNKRPALPEWRDFQERRPTYEEIDRCFAPTARYDAICIVCGEVSGNLEAIDFDQKGRAFDEWKALVDAEQPGLVERLVIQRTQSGGFHALYRCPGGVGSNDKLAHDASNMVLIETRGEGGLVLCAPSPAYEVVQGAIAEVPDISVDERETLLVCARMLDHRLREITDGPQSTATPNESDGLRPGDDFNLRGDIGPLLEKHGWRRCTTRGENQHWTRPGKESGTSATFNGTHFYVFSSNSEPFDAGRAYTKFAIRAYLEHSKDFAAASRELRREGFGSSLTIGCGGQPGGGETRDDREILGTRDPTSNRIILQAGQTVPSALAFLNEFFKHPTRFTLVHWNDEFYQWDRSRFVGISEAKLSAMMLPWLDEALTPATRSKSGSLPFVRFRANPRTAAEVVQSVASLVHVTATRCPCWLATAADQPCPSELLVCPSGSLHLPSGGWIESTPLLFTTTGLEFDFDPDAPPPSRWLAFLADLFGSDQEAIDLLQDWFGYCLTPDTSLQKMLLIVGPPRSGKGTIARVLRALVGEGNCVGPTVGGLVGSFGLQPLLGKSLAIVSDARFTGQATTPLVERLLCISGEDVITVDRKHKSPLTVRLPTRFMFLTNEIPEVADASGALASRFETLRLQRSFVGRENIQLASQLLEELPGILNWAIEGWRRLHVNRRLTTPESSRETKRALAEAGSPVIAFIEERCNIGSGHRVSVDELFLEWRGWCDAAGIEAGSKQTLGRNLTAATPAVRRRGTKATFYEGLALKSRSD